MGALTVPLPRFSGEHHSSTETDSLPTAAHNNIHDGVGSANLVKVNALESTLCTLASAAQRLEDSKSGLFCGLR